MPTTRVAVLLQAVARALFPARCPGCGVPAEPICAACLAAVRPPPAVPPPPGIDEWTAVFTYEGVARELVARAKYRGRHATLAWLAARMVSAWRATNRAPPDVVTWVPTAAAHRRARGVDHARVLARAVAAELGVPARPLLARGVGPAQTGRPLRERQMGPRISSVRRVAGSVLVVDDVATTGATLRECAAALRAAGARRVVALTAARTARDRHTGAAAVSASEPRANGARDPSPRRRGVTRSA